MPVTDPYATLGVSRDASIEDIKRAYRSLSKEWHPDKHKGDSRAEDRFKEINEAYEILSDQKKRRMFDQFGRTGNGSAGAGFGGFDFPGFGGGSISDLGDIFESFFGGRQRGTAVRDEGSDEETELVVDLVDVVAGVERDISFRALERCAACDGHGTAPGATMVTCSECGGTGQMTRTAQSFFGTIQQRTVCTVCGGSGRVPLKPCPTCGGEGRVASRRTVSVRIPAGISDGQTLRIRGEAGAGRRGAASGDLYVTVRVRPDKRFERENADIHSSATITVLDAILGAKVTVETVHGLVTLSIPEGTQPGQVFRIRGKGLPLLGTQRLGDHYVKVEVEIPKKLSRAERKLLEEWVDVRGKRM